MAAAHSARIEKRSGSVGQEAPRPSLPGEVEQAGFAPAKMLRGRAGGLGNVSANMFTRSSSVEGEAMRADTLRLVPYKVFRPGSYFGDVELLGKKMRRDTARCESTVGAPRGGVLGGGVQGSACGASGGPLRMFEVLCVDQQGCAWPARSQEFGLLGISSRQGRSRFGL